MNAFSILIGLAGVLGQAAPAAPASKSPFIGTWSVDIAKLPLPPEARPRSVTMVFSDAGGGKWTTTVDIVGPDGSKSHSVSSYALDGSPSHVEGRTRFQTCLLWH